MASSEYKSVPTQKSVICPLPMHMVRPFFLLWSSSSQQLTGYRKLRQQYVQYCLTTTASGQHQSVLWHVCFDECWQCGVIHGKYCAFLKHCLELSEAFICYISPLESSPSVCSKQLSHWLHHYSIVGRNLLAQDVKPKKEHSGTRSFSDGSQAIRAQILLGDDMPRECLTKQALSNMIWRPASLGCKRMASRCLSCISLSCLVFIQVCTSG